MLKNLKKRKDSFSSVLIRLKKFLVFNNKKKQKQKTKTKQQQQQQQQQERNKKQNADLHKTYFSSVNVWQIRCTSSYFIGRCT